MQTIELTPDERQLVESIEFFPDRPEYERAQRDGSAACALVRLLLARSAIPTQRLKFFTDPQYYPGGRGRSLQQIFERNGCVGEEIFHHPNFLRHLWYFLHGARLPAAVIEEFVKEIAGCGQVKSGDLELLRRRARQLTRDWKLNPSEADEEFFKLALDCGVYVSYADSIRRAVGSVRSR